MIAFIKFSLFFLISINFVLLINPYVYSEEQSVNKNLISPSTAILRDFRYDDQVSSEEDSVAVWIAPNPDDSLLFITHKTGNKVTVWNLKTSLMQTTLTGFNNPNGVVVDQDDNSVYVTDRLNYIIKKYLVSDILSGNLEPSALIGAGFSSSKEPMGLTVYHNAGSYIYATYTGSSTKYVRAFTSSGVLYKEWNVGSIAVESIKADNEKNLIYVADESNNMVKVYLPNGTFVQNFGQGVFGGTSPDPEGIDIYKCNNDDGYIIVSDQKANEFEIFDRNNFLNLARYRIDKAIDTDGLVITQTSLFNFPNGGFFAQSRDRFVEGVKFEKIVQATGMTLCMEITATELKASTPVISPNGGIFVDSVSISITTSTPNATIFYTTDGTIPNELSNLYSGEFAISSNTTIKAIAIKSGLNNSDIAIATFQIRQNNIPVADANGPYQSTEDISITFDGSASFDADGDNLTYYWYFGDGTNGTGVNPQHAYNSGGIYYVTLCVSDGFNKSPLSSTNVTVTEINDAPIANAGNDIIKEDLNDDGFELINLTGTGTDIDGFIVAYEWKENSVILGNNPGLTYNFTLGNHTLNFTVTDNNGSKSSDNALVTVLPKPVQLNTSNLTLFSDNFESGFGKWTESNEFDWNIEKPAEKNISNHTLPNLVAHADNCDIGCFLTMKDAIDLSNFQNATLSFYRYIDNGLDSGEFLRVDLFKSGNWNTIFNWTNKKGDDDIWHYETFDLSKYLVSDFNLRFVSKESSGSEEVEIDDVIIEGVLG